MNQHAELAVDQVPESFSDALGHIAAELNYLDLVITRRVELFRSAIADKDDKVTAVPTYVSDREVDWLLQRPQTFSQKTMTANELPIDRLIREQQDSIVADVYRCEQTEIYLPLFSLAQLFDLSWLEMNVVLLCLAPELRRKYDRIYAFLQDDITRKCPSLDLALELFVDDENERWYARSLLSEDSRLFAYGLINVIDDQHSPSGSSALSKMLQLDQRVVQFLLGKNECDIRISTFVQRLSLVNYIPCINEEQSQHQQQLLTRALSHTANKESPVQPPVFHLYGGETTSKRDTAIALCQGLESDLLIFDARIILTTSLHFEKLISLILRESVLQQTPLLIEHVDELLREDPSARGRLTLLTTLVNRYAPLIFTSAIQCWPAAHSSALTVINFNISPPNAKQYQQLWNIELDDLLFSASDDELLNITQKFYLSPEQIISVSKQLHMQYGASDTPISLKVLAKACRDISHHSLNNLSTSINVHYQWNDLVLPNEIEQQLRSICSQAHYGQQVFEDWGFAQKLPYGRGLSAMFTGSPGTGKTMAAQVIANDLQLELFKIDLSGVVSKYIGETEKNLNRVFTEAKASNAILFFDEADALFGKRTDVSDAHDRYANIEVSYLLQKMEEYEGIVILATNLRNNIDDAFLRRIRFILEFPFPDTSNRLEIWQKSFPEKMPIDGEIDFQWLAERIKVAGGNIKNIVLNAAFSAAQNNQILNMSHLIEGCQQEFRKIGKLWDTNFMQHQKNTKTKEL